MTSAWPPAAPPDGVGRRTVLLAGLAGALALPLAAACTSRSSDIPDPDPLRKLAETATADAAVAKGIAAKYPSIAYRANLVATNRNQQAAALWQEVNRANPTTSAPSTSSAVSPSANPSVTDARSATAILVSALSSAQDQASALVLTSPSYRAGLIGSVAAGCACLKEVLS